MGEVTLSELLDFKPRLWTSQADKWEKNANELATQATDIHAAADNLESSLTGPSGKKASAALRDKADQLLKASDVYLMVSLILSEGAGKMEEHQAKAGDLKRQLELGHVDVHEDGLCTPQFTINPIELARRASLAGAGTAKLKSILQLAVDLDRRIAEALKMRESLPPVDTAKTGPIDISIGAIQAAAATDAQGEWGNCVQLSSLRALAKANPQWLEDHVNWDAKKGAYVVNLWDPDTGEPKDVYVDPTMLTDSEHDSKDPSKLTIFDIYEQALISVDPTHSGENLSDGFETIMGKEADWAGSTGEVIDAVNDDKAVTAGGSKQDYKHASIPAEKRLVPNHAYHVKEITPDGNIVLENPWGPNGGTMDGVHFPGRVELTPEEYDKWIGHSAVANS
uniref:hypothetical protein n=1 Tax=Tessaracoccus timonensis TaxID=2161816 RepID=UPI000D556D93|nr:hypothetical protein [Tessaracoccus timonensis]